MGFVLLDQILKNYVIEKAKLFSIVHLIGRNGGRELARPLPAWNILHLDGSEAEVEEFELLLEAVAGQGSRWSWFAVGLRLFDRVTLRQLPSNVVCLQQVYSVERTLDMTTLIILVIMDYD